MKENRINGEITEFDVLTYICHSDNIKKFDKTRSALKVRDDVNKIMKLFMNLNIHLLNIDNKVCPEDIKAEFAPEIIEMGQGIYPFESSSKQNKIRKVLKYFTNTTDNTAVSEERQECGKVRTGCLKKFTNCCSCRCCPCTHIALENSATLSEVQSHDVEMPLLILSSRNQDSIHGLRAYRGHHAIESAIPYINFFNYENFCFGKRLIGSSHLVCDISCSFPHIKHLERCVKEKRLAGRDNEIRKWISEFWSLNGDGRNECESEGDLLHLIRMVMYQLNVSNVSNVEALENFIKRIENIENKLKISEEEMNIRFSTGALQMMQDVAGNLQNPKNPRLEKRSTRMFLMHYEETLREFSHVMPRTSFSKAEVNGRCQGMLDDIKTRISDLDAKKLLEDEDVAETLEFQVNALKKFILKVEKSSVA